MISFFTPWYTRLAVETAVFLVPAYMLLSYPHFPQNLLANRRRLRRRENYEQSNIQLDTEQYDVKKAEEFHSQFNRRVNY